MDKFRYADASNWNARSSAGDASQDAPYAEKHAFDSCWRSGMHRSLFFTLKMLNAGGVLAAAFFDEGRLRVWLGDQHNGMLDSATFDGNALDDASAWLNEQALEHYPNSSYAKVKRLLAASLTETVILLLARRAKSQR